MVAFGRLGWTVEGNGIPLTDPLSFSLTHICEGNVPPVYTPGNDKDSSWDKIDALNARNFSGMLSSFGGAMY